MSLGWWVVGGSAVALLVLASRDAPAAKTKPPPRTLPQTDEERIATLTPEVQPEVRALLARAVELGFKPRVASARRTCAEQRDVFAQGRTRPGPVISGADGCRSFHVWGMAVDLSGVPPEGLKELGAWWRARGGVWGGSFNDPGHYEWHPNLKIEAICPDPARCEEAVENRNAVSGFRSDFSSPRKAPLFLV